MKEKTKEFLKKYLIGFVLGVVSAGVVIVYAETYFPSNDVTYDNTESGLASTNVQGAIDELYGVCFPSAGDQIIEDAGLEKDPYECRYFFTGANPNNYITFNDETAGWRIMSVECDGTIKIIRNESIEKMAWDSSNSNNWARPASLNTYLNSTYYNELNSIAQSQIVAKDWSIGKIADDNKDLADQINDENGTKWNGKIALATASEYIRSNSNKNSCGSFYLINSDYFMRCRNTTWMYYSSDWWWTLSPLSGANNYMSRISKMGGINHTGSSTTHTGPSNIETAVRPALYLSSDVTLTGSGTQSAPYTIE